MAATTPLEESRVVKEKAIRLSSSIGSKAGLRITGEKRSHNDENLRGKRFCQMRKCDRQSLARKSYAEK